MRRILSVIVLALLPALCPAQYRTGSPYSELNESEVCLSMRSDVEFFSCNALEGRKAGSQGEKEAALYLASRLEECGVDVLSGKEGDIFGLKQDNSDTLVSRNVIGFIPGYDKELKNNYIVIGARLDGPGSHTVIRDGVSSQAVYPGANGNASGLAMLVQLARMLSTNSVLLRRSVIIAGFGASLKDCAGSWYFLNRSFPDVGKIDAFVNLDMVGTGNSGLYAYTASNQDLNEAILSLAGTLQPIRPEIVSLEPVCSDHRSFYGKQIPSVFFTTGMYPEYNTERDRPSILEYDWMERILEYVYNFSLSIANGKKPSFSREEQAKPKGLLGADDAVPFFECDRKPTFLGSSDPATFLRRWVYVYQKYPEGCVRDGIQGRVLVEFVIDEKGKVCEVVAKKGPDQRLEDEAVRIISASPDWKPGVYRGKKVRTRLSLYVEFRLAKKK